MQSFIVWQNAFLFGLDLCLLAILGTYVVSKTRKGLWRTASTSAGAAFLIYFAGMAWVRGSLLAWRHGWLSDGSEAKADIPLLAIGTIVAVVGATCILRLFADYAWRRLIWAWIWCVVVDAIAATLLTIY